MNVKKNIIVVSGLAVLVTATYFGFGAASQSQSAHAESKAEAVALDNDKARLGYTIGAQIGGGLAQQGMVNEIDLDALILAVRDFATGAEAKITPEEMVKVQQAFQLKKQQEFASLGAQNLTQGEAFLEKNKSEADTTVTETGLQFQVVREGKGKQPSSTNKVKIHYLGSLIDGTTFDSSYKRNEPTEFPVTGVIPGFSEGLQLMKEGGKYRIVIPAALAYGEQGPASIGPNQVLIFEVELLEVI